jgi:hypothetical protein
VKQQIGYAVDVQNKKRNSGIFNMGYGPGTASRRNLEGLCDDMTDVVMDVYDDCEVDFSVIQSSRTEEEQRANMEADPPVSWTMDSDHLRIDDDDSGVLAVDVYPWFEGRTSLDPDHYKLLAKSFFKCAARRGVQIKWGGFWTGSRTDPPHFAKRRGT